MLNFGLSNLNLSSIVGAQGLYCSYQQNPLLIGAMNPMFPTNNQGLQEAAEWGALLMDKQKLTNQVGYLAGFDSQIKTFLKSDKLDESQKQRLQDVLDQVKALKEKAQKMLAKQDLKSEEIEALLGEIEELKENASEVAKEVLEEVQAAAEEAEADGAGDADDGDGTDGTDDADGADDADDDTADAKDPDKSADEAVAAEFDKKQKEKENEAAEICQNIYSGSVGCSVDFPTIWGTNYDTIKKGTEKITKDNVTTVLNMWTSQYKQNTNDVNLIETLFNEESMWNPGLADDNPEPGHKVNTVEGNLDIIWNIIVALDERAQELGIKNKIAGLFAVCYDELDDFNVDQDAVINSVTKITEAVTKAEAQQTKKDMATAKENKVKADAANKKAKKAEEEAKKVQDQKTRFRDAMRYALDDDKAEISSDVRYENNKFVITIHGEDYYGKNYKELVKALEKDGLDPAQYLKQRSLNAVA